MATQVLAGSKGNYIPRNPDAFGNTEFIVMCDTCMESAMIPVYFPEQKTKCSIEMTRVKFKPDIKTQDF